MANQSNYVMSWFIEAYNHHAPSCSIVLTWI